MNLATSFSSITPPQKCEVFLLTEDACFRCQVLNLLLTAQPNFFEGEHAICLKGESSSNRHKLKLKKKPQKTPHQHGILRHPLTRRGNSTRYTGLACCSDENQGTNEQSRPFLRLSRSLLHFLRSKPFVTVVCCHGLHKEKRYRVQNSS